MNLCLSDYGELFVIDLDQVVYLQADDHYTHVYYASEAHFMVPFGLSCLEESINDITHQQPFLLRIGRKYIINVKKVFHINVGKQIAVLTNDVGKNISLHISQAALQSLIDKFKNEEKTIINTIQS